MMGAGAIVIGGDYRGLGIVRSLGRHGIPVWVLTDQHTLAATSRYAQRSLHWPESDEAGQVAYLLELAKKYGLEGWLIFPTGDETTAMVSRHREALSARFRVTVPSWDVLRWMYDKRLTYQLAEELGVACPWTYYPKCYEDLAALPCTFPVILKPAIKESFNQFVHDKAWRVDDRAALLARYQEAQALVAADCIMVQELIPGGGEMQYSYAALLSQGEPCASLVARRLRQYPVDFGRSSTYVETTEQPEIEEAAQHLLRAKEFTGLVEVEFKRDVRDGQFKLLDVNPRVWGWHSIGRRAGVDFPFLLWQLSHGQPIARVRGAAGIRWVRAVTDVPTVVREIRRREMTASSYLRSLSGPLECAIFAVDDPLPALVEVPLLAYIAYKRGAA